MNNRKLLTVGTILLLVFLVGCSKEETAQAPPPAQPAAAPAAPVDMANAATIVGKVVFKDGKPRAVPIRMDADAACKAMHVQPVTSQEVVVNDNGTLRYAFVYVSAGLGDRSFPTPAQSVELDQQGCLYAPHVIGVQVNQEVKIVNSDKTTHNIHPVPKVNREWNTSMPPGSDPLVRTFAREETMIPVKCNIHPWMRSYIAVLKHPFYSVTGDTGQFEIKGLPPGEYTLTAWHEKYGTVEQKVTVGAKETKTVEFVFQPTSGSD